MALRIKLDASLMSVDDLSRIPNVAAGAAAAGFDGLWASEVNHDPFLQLGLAATHSEHLELGTAIALSFTRSPMVLAHSAWDLAALTGGRFTLGLGTQVRAHNERRFSVPWSAPVSRLREVVESLRAIWQAWRTGERLNYRGEHYTFTLMTPFFTPPRHDYDIPIAIAGVNTGLCRLAGEVAEGFHVHPLNSPAYLREVVRPAIAEGAAQAGRSPDAVSLIASVFVVTGRDDAEMARSRESVRQQISFYASTPSYKVMLETHGWAGVGERLSRLAARKQWGEMAKLVGDEMVEAFAVVAPPAEVGRAVLARYEGLVDRVMLYHPYVPGEFDELWAPAIRAFSEQA